MTARRAALAVASFLASGCLLDWSSSALDGGPCGDGVIQAGEECDAGPSEAPGCVDCRVVCECLDSCDDLMLAFVRPADHHCYLSRNENRGWDYSVATCDLNAMGLASLTTRDEIDFVVSEVQSNIAGMWVGASDEAVEGSFEWLDPDEEWTAEHDTWWISGEPTSLLGTPEHNEDYVALNRAFRGFEDRLPGAGNGMLCERRPPGEPAP